MTLPARVTARWKCAVPGYDLASLLFFLFFFVIFFRQAPIVTTDFLLRGVALPPGSHRVEMRYTAPAARTGAFISVFSLLVILGLFVYNRGLEYRLQSGF